MPTPDYVRVKQAETGHQLSVPRRHFERAAEGAYELLDKPATDAGGQPLPPKYNITPRPKTDAGDGDGVTEPPRSGAGSGVEAWRTHATGLGIDVPEGATRDDVIALVDNTPKGL